ncbi:MAG: MFS transporter [Kiritimatiellae bacterium]|nr:MFS transporter [Kiritimatiellia bacterium]MCO5069487.1 MFS transporter [Kiritimatiellia bacterium]
MNHNPPMRRGYVLLALMMTMMLAAMDSTIVSTSIPEIVSELGGFAKFSWVFSAYLLAQTITISLYGKLADIYGRKKIMVVGVTIFLFGSAACASSWNIDSLIFFRVVQGLGAGSILASVNTIAGDIYTLEERGKIQGWLSSVWGVSAIVGPAIGGALTAYINWRWIFIINLPVGILSLFFLGVHLREALVSRRPAIDYLGAVLILLSVGLFIVYLLEGGQRWPWFGKTGLALLATTLVLATLMVRVERAAAEPILPPWIWRNRTLVFTNLSMVFMGIVMMGPETFLPTFAQAALGLGIIASGFVLATMSIGWPIASGYSAKVYMRIGFRNASLIGALLLVLACVGFLFIPRPQSIPLLVLDQLLLGAGFGLLSTPALVGAQSIVGWEQRGVVTGLVIFTRNLGQSLGAAIFGAIFNNSFQRQMSHAPVAMREGLTDILHVLKEPGIPVAKRAFLREAINLSTHHIYIGLSLFAILALFAICLMPARIERAGGE